MFARHLLPLLLPLYLVSQWVVAAPADTLDALHEASDAREFLGQFGSDAVFIAPNNTRQQGEALSDYAINAFSAAGSWGFRASERYISYSDDGSVAWFSEALTRPDGSKAWGAGVLVKGGAGWKIAQYSITPAGATDKPIAPAHATGAAATGASDTAPAKRKKHCSQIRHKTNRVSNC